MKIKYLAFAVVLLVGCNKSVDIKDGQLPAELVPFAQKLTGTYEGRFNGVPNAVTLSLDGNKLVASTAQDLLGDGCGSSLGSLTRVAYSGKSEKDVEIKKAEFALNHGNCRGRAVGKELVLSGKEKDGRYVLKATLLVGYHWEEEWEPGEVVCQPSGPRGGGYCWRTPGHMRSVRVPDYEYGEFYR